MSDSRERKERWYGRCPMLSFALALVLTQSPDAGVEPEPEPFVHLSAGAEGELGVLPSGWGENGADVMFGFRPMVGMRVADVFAVPTGLFLSLRTPQGESRRIA